MLGVLVMAGGLTRMVWAFRAGCLGRGVLVFLSVLLALYFLADGLAEIVTGAALTEGQAGKGWLIFDGMVTLILGVMIFTGFPLSGFFALGVLLGVKLLFAGTTMLTLVVAAGGPIARPPA